MMDYKTRMLVAEQDVAVGSNYYPRGAHFPATEADADYLISRRKAKDATTPSEPAEPPRPGPKTPDQVTAATPQQQPQPPDKINLPDTPQPPDKINTPEQSPAKVNTPEDPKPSSALTSTASAGGLMPEATIVAEGAAAPARRTLSTRR